MSGLGVGIVGCGNISGIYLANVPLFDGIAVRAVADLRPEAAAAQSEAYGVEAVSVDALLARDDIDIVVNLTVPNVHAAVSTDALSAGKHVFCEKPLATDLDDGRRLVEEADSRGLLIGCAPDTFLGAGGRLARALLDQGTVGRVLSGTAFVMGFGMEHWHPDPTFFYQPGGGPVLDVGPYYIAALINLMGPVARVSAVSSTGFSERLVSAEGPRQGQKIPVNTPTTIFSILEFASGAQILMGASWDVWKHGHTPIELYGSDGSMRVPDPNFFGGVVETTERDSDWTVHDTAAMPLGRPNWPADKPTRANYRALGVAELASAVRQGTPHRVSGRFALHTLEVLRAICDAGESDTAVAIETTVDRPAALGEDDAARLFRPS